MSVPFPNTHLRVPRGFGTILEGLAREILRDQPEDIPEYAAQYFDALLRQRDEGGLDPAEWAAKLEDRLYSNNAFEATGGQNEPVASREEEAEVTVSKETSYESQTEDESSKSADISNLPATQPEASEEIGSTENAEEEQKLDETDIIKQGSEGLSEEEAVNRVPVDDVQLNKPDRAEEEERPTKTTFDEDGKPAIEEDTGSVLDQDLHQDDFEANELLLYKEMSNIDVCAQELGGTENEVGVKSETEVVDKETVALEPEEKTEVEVPVEVFPYSGLADVDLCATELRGTEHRINTEDDTYVNEEKSSKYQPERNGEQSLLSESETPEGNQEKADKAEEKEEAADTESFSGGIHESIASLDGGLDSNAAPKEDSLVEISFEDVPQVEMTEVLGEKEPGDEDSAEVQLNKILHLQQQEESEEVTALETDQILTDAQSLGESEMVGMEEEVKSEGEELESRLETSDLIKENIDTNGSSLNETDKEGEGNKNIITSHQLTPEAEEEKPEAEASHKINDNERIIEAEFHQNEDSEKEMETSNAPDFEHDEMTDSLGEDTEETQTEGYSKAEERESNNGGKKNLSSQENQANQSTPELEADRETLETNEQLLHVEDEDSKRTDVEPQSEDARIEKEVSLKEETSHAEDLVEEEDMDTEILEESDAMERSVSVIQSDEHPAADHQGDETSTADPEANCGDKEECSRPQEEEDIMDIPLDDPEANRAAAKIQAGFRGHMTRKKMKPEDKSEGEEVSSTGDVLNGSQGDTETGGSGAVERDDTSVPEQ